MAITQNNFISTTLYLNHNTASKNGRTIRTIFSARKRDFSGKSKTEEKQFTLKISNKIIFQSVIAVLGLGFIDAGYSGDWSRIGVLTKESEDLLKLAAFTVVPVCLFLILSIGKEQKS